VPPWKAKTIIASVEYFMKHVKPPPEMKLSQKCLFVISEDVGWSNSMTRVLSESPVISTENPFIKTIRYNRGTLELVPQITK
jgi:hypothetical protein